MVHNLVFRWPKPLIFLVCGAHGLYLWDFAKATCKCANSTSKYLCMGSASFVPYQVRQQALNCLQEMLSNCLSCCGMLLALLLLLRRLLLVPCSVMVIVMLMLVGDHRADFPLFRALASIYVSEATRVPARFQCFAVKSLENHIQDMK